MRGELLCEPLCVVMGLPPWAGCLSDTLTCFSTSEAATFGCLGLLPFLLSEVGVLIWERDLDPVAGTLYSPSHPVSGQGLGHPLGRDLGLPLILPPLNLLSLLPYARPHCCCHCPSPYKHGRPASTWVTLGPTLFSCCLALGILYVPSFIGLRILTPSLA